MKTRDQKYKEAVERNMRHVKKNANSIHRDGVKEDKAFSLLKMRLGIRSTDNSMDSALHDAINKVFKSAKDK